MWSTLAYPAHAQINDPSFVDVEALLDAPSGGVEGFIRAAFEGRSLDGIELHQHAALDVFYESRAYKPYWVNENGLRREARDLIALIDDSWAHGLNPRTYHSSRLRELLPDRTPASLAGIELLLSDAYLHLGQDLTGIRVDPAPLKTRKSFWRQPMPHDILLTRLKNDDVAGVFEAISPQGRTYRRLQQELRDIVMRPASNYEALLPIKIDQILKPGEAHKGVIDLRVRLDVPGDVEYPMVYDDNVAAAVVAFQRQNGLKADGYIGPQTLDVLNITREQRIRQIIANLERLRWVSEERPGKYVVVNIPSATLWAVEGGELAFEMPVIVGTRERPTNIFITEISGVRFNPTWTVPYTIKREDIFPALQADATYLSQKGMELILGQGDQAVSVDPASIDWLNMNIDDLSAFRMVQIPGKHNPLGRVRVLMSNPYNIYLHDTNKPHYFERASRALSSGCVRLKEPERMAQFIMAERDGWSLDDMQSIFEDGKTSDLAVSRRIPVYLLYYTVWLNDDGEVVYGHDLYGHDEKLIKMLSKLDEIFIPVDNNGNIRLEQSLASD